MIIFNVNIHAFNVADQLNNFFQSELNFVQKSLNKKNNSVDESTGVLTRNIDNTIQIEIFKPYGESYLINEHEIKIHDLEFNQTRNISLKEFENNFFLDFIINNLLIKEFVILLIFFLKELIIKSVWGSKLI